MAHGGLQHGGGAAGSATGGRTGARRGSRLQTFASERRRQSRLEISRIYTSISGAGKRTAASGVVGCASLRGPLCAGEALLEARTQASVALFKLGAHSATLRPEFGGPESLRCCCAKGVGHRAQLMMVPQSAKVSLRRLSWVEPAAAVTCGQTELCVAPSALPRASCGHGR